MLATGMLATGMLVILNTLIVLQRLALDLSNERVRFAKASF